MSVPSPMVIRCLVALLLPSTASHCGQTDSMAGWLVRCCVVLRVLRSLLVAFVWYCARRSGCSDDSSSCSGSIAGHNITLRDSVGV